MAEADWTFLTGGLSAQQVDRGVTSGLTSPNGGGTFVYGFNSLQVTSGGVGLFTNLVNFAPMASGCSIRGAVQRGVSGGNENWSAGLFCGWQGTAVSDGGYMLGLQDDDPSAIVLRKVPSGSGLLTGLVEGDVDPLNNGILLKSTDTVAIGEWVHLRLDMVVNGTGDVVLNVYKSDLSANTVGSPVWELIPGMTTVANPNGFLDDSLGVNSGTSPFTSGRAGFGYTTTDVTRRAYFDHIEVLRQL